LGTLTLANAALGFDDDGVVEGVVDGLLPHEASIPITATSRAGR
jgi:hypothetical protein